MVLIIYQVSLHWVLLSMHSYAQNFSTSTHPKNYKKYHDINCDRLINGNTVKLPLLVPINTRNFILTHWGRVMHICVSNLTIIDSDNGLLPDWRQTIICTNAGILLIGPLGTNFSENIIGIQKFSIYKMLLKMLSAKWRLFRLGLNELKIRIVVRKKFNPIASIEILDDIWINDHQ